MRIGLIILVITCFLIINLYYDNYYTKYLTINKKYFQMFSVGFIGLALYLLLKRNPKEAKEILMYANRFIRYVPIDKTAKSFITPVLDLTSMTSMNSNNSPQMKRLVNSGRNTTKRSVSETKKKYVASQQNWKCGNCNIQLPAWFEIDHKIRLEHGGTNHISNLVAYCRDCHGKKTALESM